MWVFGFLCFATKLNNSDKFSEQSEECVLLGYFSVKKVINCLASTMDYFLFQRCDVL